MVCSASAKLSFAETHDSDGFLIIEHARRMCLFFFPSFTSSDFVAIVGLSALQHVTIAYMSLCLCWNQLFCSLLLLKIA